MELTKINDELNIKHLVFEQLPGCVSKVARNDCLASAEVKHYLNNRYPKFADEIFEKYSVYGRSSLYKYKILNNWQMKRLIRDIDTICVFAGTRKRCVVDRSIKVTKECMQVLKGMECKPVIQYDNQPTYKGEIFEMGVDDAAKDLGITIDKPSWSSYSDPMDRVDYIHRPAIRRKLREYKKEKNEKWNAGNDKFMAKNKEREAKLEGFAPVKKTVASYKSFKKALMENDKITMTKPTSEDKVDGEHRFDASSLISAALSNSKTKILKNLVLSGNLNPWKTVKNGVKSPREDLLFNDNLISVSNYYSSLFDVQLSNESNCIEKITMDYIRLSTKVKLGCVKMEPESEDELIGTEFKGTEKLRKKLLKKIKKVKNDEGKKNQATEVMARSAVKMTKNEKRLVKRSENPVLLRFHNMGKSLKRNQSTKISRLINFLSSESAGNRFERLFNQHYPHYRLNLLAYKNFKNFLKKMDDVAISKIWSKTETEEIKELPAEFFEGLENVKAISAHLDFEMSLKEASLLKIAHTAIENVLSVAEEINEKEGLEAFIIKEKERERKEDYLSKEKLMEEKRKKLANDKRIAKEEKNRIRRERIRIEEEYYDQFDCENF